MSEAIEPSVKKAHNVINNGVGNIVIISGSNNIVTFNAQSKEYISTQEEDDEVRQLTVSCGMLNVNTRNGRVYNYELGSTVAIHVTTHAHARTLRNLALSLQRYSSGDTGIRSEVTIVFTTERSINGDDKKYFVTDAFFIDE